MNDRRTRLETARKHCILHLICELEHTVHVGLALFAFLYKRLELFIHSVFATEECVHFVFFDREACLCGPVQGARGLGVGWGMGL
jgi:hypothetical protein